MRLLLVTALLFLLCAPAYTADTGLELHFYSGSTPAAGYGVVYETCESWVPPCVMTGTTDSSGVVIFENVPETDYTISLYADGLLVNSWNRTWDPSVGTESFYF